ncbi:MAG: hypothetical protein KIT22_15545, partial [Verrucomicrobiae bacterium]|nr:hypothetical protein [Verrucomicrobiae bacterium]
MTGNAGGAGPTPVPAAPWRPWGSRLGIAATGMATALLLVTLMVILGVAAIQGLPALSWRFVSTVPRRDFFDVQSAAVLPMILGTTVRVLLMTVFVMPVG